MRQVPLRRTGAVVLAVTAVLAACGDEEPDATSSTEDEAPPYPSIGVVPAPAEPGSDGLEEARCEMTPDDALIVDGSFVNGSPVPVFVNTLDVTLPEDPDADDDELRPVHVGLTVGPGRRLSLDEGPADASVATGPCEVAVDARPDRDPDGQPFPADAVRLSGCGPDDAVEVVNPTDDLIGVAVTIEFFDPAGFSEGRYSYTDFPESDAGGPAVGGVTGAASASLDVNMVRDVVGCEVVGAVYVVDPEPIRVEGRTGPGS